MNSLIEYVNQLSKDYDDMKTNLQSKGITINGDEKLSKLVEYISSIQQINGIDPSEIDRNGTRTSFVGFFAGETGITKLPVFDTSSGTIFTSFLRDCSSLKELHGMDTSNGTIFASFLANCTSLEKLIDFNIDTSNGTDFSGFMQNCPKLKTLPSINTTNGSNFSYIFGSSGANEIPFFDVSNGTNFTGFLQYCSEITTLPNFKIVKATIFKMFLRGCSKLVSIPFVIETSRVNSPSSFDEFLKDCPKLESFKVTTINVTTTYFDFSTSPLLTRQCLIDFIDAIKYSKPTTLRIGTENRNKIIDKIDEYTARGITIT